MNLDFFPPLNATLNGIAGLFLVLGFILVKQGNRKGHAVCMVSALAVSAVFLVCYVTFKTLKRKSGPLRLSILLTSQNAEQECQSPQLGGRLKRVTCRETWHLVHAYP